MNLVLYTTKNQDEITGKIPENYLRFLMKNPFSYDGAPIMLRVEEKDICIGSVYAFPIQLCYKNSETFTACAGSTLFVNPQSRGKGIAKSLTLKRLDLSKDKIAIASGLSSMSLPLFKKLEFNIFMSQRNIFLKNSRPVVEIFLKNSFFLTLFSSIANIFLKLQRSILNWQRKRIFTGFKVEETTTVPQEVADIVANDTALFRENHTKEWFEWVLKGGFTDDTRSTQHLFVVKQANEIIGFYMTKERFHEQASHRGFRNVILGSVIEWGVKQSVSIKDEYLVLDAILSFGKHVHAVEVCSAYANINRFLKKRFLISIGKSNFAIRAQDDSPFAKYSEYKNQCNWRIRPAASDNSFN